MNIYNTDIYIYNTRIYIIIYIYIIAYIIICICKALTSDEGPYQSRPHTLVAKALYMLKTSVQ